MSQANLPNQVDIEFVRTKRLEQFFHSLSWNKNKKTYAELQQPKSYSEKNPKILISTDFAQDFFNINFAKFGHSFLSALRKEYSSNDKEKCINRINYFLNKFRKNKDSSSKLKM